MNILLLTSTFLPSVGGREMVTHDLATALSYAGHRAVVVAPYHPKWRTPVDHPYRVVRYGFRGYGKLHLQIPLALLTLSLSVLRYKIHVISVHNVLGPGSLAHTLTRIFKNIPVVGTPHGDDIQQLPEIAYGNRFDPKYEKVLRRNLEFFILVTAISHSVRENLRDLLDSDRKIRDIPNGVWFSTFQKPIDRAEVRAQYGIPQDSIALITIGRNHPIKSFKTAIEALALCGSMIPKISLILVGRGMESIVQRAQAIGVSQLVITPGEVSRSDVARLLKASDIYISSSLMESFGLTTLEAMCAGLPSIVSNVHGTKNLVSPDCAILFNAANPQELAKAILRLARDFDLRMEMGNRARIEAMKYDWPRVADMYLNVFKEAITYHHDFQHPICVLRP